MRQCWRRILFDESTDQVLEYHVGNYVISNKRRVIFLGSINLISKLSLIASDCCDIHLSCASLKHSTVTLSLAEPWCQRQKFCCWARSTSKQACPEIQHNLL